MQISSNVGGAVWLFMLFSKENTGKSHLFVGLYVWPQSKTPFDSVTIGPIGPDYWEVVLLYLLTKFHQIQFNVHGLF